jgi:hypothetical protein
MPGKRPKIIYLFRIVHIKNIEYLLTHGMFTREHAKADPRYINIGDSNLIEQRKDYPVGINPPNGTLGEYVPFYFGPLSPMLLNIKTGYRGIKQRPQDKIVYVCCKLDDLITQCTEWCFTDGHAKNRITSFYNTIHDLNKVDWNIVAEQYWSNTEDDYDRMRRKQAEFLVKVHVPVQCIHTIVVFNQETSTLVKDILVKLSLNINVSVNPKNRFYYP